MEIWKDVINYEGLYQVSNLGRVKSLERIDALNRIVKEKIRKQRVGTTGYYVLDLSKDGKLKPRKVHQLVVESFLNHKPDGTQKLVVNHINRIRTDNRLENLEIVTQRENSSYHRPNTYSKYIGVTWHKHKNKWMSSLRIQGKTKYLGYFDNELDAANAYNEAKSKL